MLALGAPDQPSAYLMASMVPHVSFVANILDPYELGTDNHLLMCFTRLGLSEHPLLCCEGASIGASESPIPF